MTPVELDTFRAQLIAKTPALALIVCGRPTDYVFDGRESCLEGAPCSKALRCSRCGLEGAQLRHNENRLLFITTKSTEAVRRLVGDLLRTQAVLERAATGWRDTAGVVHRFGVHAPVLMCPHDRDLNGPGCETCETQAAECDAL